MPGCWKRASDRKRGKQGRWSIWYKGSDGRKRTMAGFTDKAKSLDMANRLDAEARLVRAGLSDPSKATQKQAATAPIAEHIAAFVAVLKSRGRCEKYLSETKQQIAVLLELAGCEKVSQVTTERLQIAIGEYRKTRAAKTSNNAMTACKSFVRWLDDTGRIERVPRGLLAIPSFNTKIDRRLVRRAATKEEIERLLRCTEESCEPVVAKRDGRGGPAIAWMTGAQRCALYRLAMSTGFRRKEMGSLTPATFHLVGDEPYVEIAASVEKSRMGTKQPISREFAAWFSVFIAGCDRGEPIFVMPPRTAMMLKKDLERAGIPFLDEQGRRLDLHALRTSYITHLVASGANPKIVQTLARHASITMTMDTYCRVDDRDIRAALENKEKPE